MGKTGGNALDGSFAGGYFSGMGGCFIVVSLLLHGARLGSGRYGGLPLGTDSFGAVKHSHAKSA